LTHKDALFSLTPFLSLGYSYPEKGGKGISSSQKGFTEDARCSKSNLTTFITCKKKQAQGFISTILGHCLIL